MSGMTGIQELFKLGLGPSSSHTMGPMTAARAFVADAAALAAERGLDNVRLRAELYGSLARTGKGHGADKAVVGGFAGLRAAVAEPAELDYLMETVRTTGRLPAAGLGWIAFDLDTSIVFDKATAPGRHPNAM